MQIRFEEDFELQEVRLFKDDEKEPRSIIKMKNGKSPFNFKTRAELEAEAKAKANANANA